MCEVANDNDPSQVVLSGHASAIERAIGLAKDMGAKRAVQLPVSAPFHCSLMQPAADAMADALSYEVLKAPAVPLYANVTAAADQRPRHHPRPARRAGDRHGPLARKHRQHGRGRRRGLRRAGRQGARPDGQAHRSGRQGDQRRHHRGHRGAGEGDSHDVRPDGNDGAGDRRQRRARQRNCQGAGGAGRAAGGVGQQRRQAGELPLGARRRPCRVALQPVRRRRGRPARAAGGRGAGRQARHPRQQCRHHPRQPFDADEGRGIRGGHPGQPGSRLPADARRRQADDEGAVRPHHLGDFGGRCDRQSRARPIMSRRRRG